MVECLKMKAFKKGQYIAKQGERGKKFFIIVKGETKVEEIDNQGNVVETDYKYKEGDFFGARSLLRD